MGEEGEDERLLRTINEGGKSSVNKGSGKKQPKKEPKREEDMPRKSIEDEGILDPRSEFLDILRDIGLKKGIEVMADVFYTGDINDPEWLDQTLTLGSVSVPHRRLIITRYYGESPEDMGMELMPAKSQKQDKSKKESDSSGLGIEDIKKTQAQLLKDRFESANIRAMLREIEELESDKKNKTTTPKKVVERPLMKDGEIIFKDGMPVMERIITDGDMAGYQTSGSELTNIVALMKMMEKDKKPYDPNEKPSWAVDLENQIKVNKAEEEKKRLEDELRREKDKRDDLEKEYKKELEKTKEQHQRDISNFAKETTEKFESIKDSFNAELKHRDEMDILRSQFGEQFSALKEELDFTKKDIKSAVVTEVTKTGGKVVDKFTDTVDGVVTPMASVVKDMYKLQIDNMRRAQGLDTDNIVPSTTEEELEELL